jgi:hypothetical protein
VKNWDVTDKGYRSFPLCTVTEFFSPPAMFQKRKIISFMILFGRLFGKLAEIPSFSLLIPSWVDLEKSKRKSFGQKMGSKLFPK